MLYNSHSIERGIENRTLLYNSHSSERGIENRTLLYNSHSIERGIENRTLLYNSHSIERGIENRTLLYNSHSSERGIENSQCDQLMVFLTFITQGRHKTWLASLQTRPVTRTAQVGSPHACRATQLGAVQAVGANFTCCRKHDWVKLRSDF